MKGFKKISTRIFFGIFTGTVVVISLTSVINYLYTKNYVVSIVEALVSRSLSAAYNDLSSDIRPLIVHAEAMAYAVAEFKAEDLDIQDMQILTLTKFPELVGNGIAKVELGKRVTTNYVTHDSTKSKGGNAYNYIHAVFYDSLSQFRDELPFYIQFHSDTVRFYYPYRHHSLEVFIWYDMLLTDYVQTVEQYTENLPSRHYLFDPYAKAVLNDGIKFSPVSIEDQEEDIEEIKKYIEKGASGLVLDSELSDKRILFIGELKGTGYTLASTLRPNVLINRLRAYLAISYIFSIVALFVLAYILIRIINKLTRPISELTEISRKIEYGSLHTTVPEYEGDGETKQLSDTLRIVQSRMQHYVQSLNSTLKTKRAYENELKIANKIQFDMIPGARRALTEYPEIDLFAEMIPAKGVAGDFYDYFFLDEENLFFVIGDVSGKGIPAALFMVKALTLIEREAVKQREPALVFETVNDQLCKKNEESMFVTAICGSLNINTGEMSLCDAGHNAPIFSYGGAEFNYVNLNKGMPLGVMQEKKYHTTTYKLALKDTLFFYTDGFPECVGRKGAMLGEDKFLAGLKQKEEDELAKIAQHAWDLLKGFRKNTPASDDATLLLLRFFGDK